MKSSIWSCVLVISVSGVSDVMCLLRVNSAALWTGWIYTVQALFLNLILYFLSAYAYVCILGKTVCMPVFFEPLCVGFLCTNWLSDLRV